MRTADSKMTIERRLKQRAAIEFLAAVCCAPIFIHQIMTALYGDSCVDVTRWAKIVKAGNPATANLLNHARSGRPTTTTDTQHQSPMDKLIRANGRAKKKYIAIILRISTQ